MTAAQICDLESLKKQNAELQHTVIYLTEQLDWFKRQIFGKKSERIVSDLNTKQLQFEGFEALEVQDEKQTRTVAGHERRKPNRNGQDAITLDPNLPVKTTTLDVPEEEKVCKETGIPLVQIGT